MKIPSRVMLGKGLNEVGRMYEDIDAGTKRNKQHARKPWEPKRAGKKVRARR